MAFPRNESNIIRPIGSFDTTALVNRRISRRRALQLAGATAGALTMPYVFVRRSGAQAAKLQFWNFYGPGGTVKTQSDWFETMVKSWNDQNETQVELVYVPSSDYINGTKLQTAFASGEGPDIFLISPGDFLRYYNGGVLNDLTPFMDQAAIDDFFPDVLASRQVDSKIYGLPMEVEPMAFYYDKTAFSDAGLSESDVPQTWTQLLDVAQKLTTDERFGVSFETGPGYYQNFTWYPFMWEGGAELVNADGKTSGMRDPGAVQALKLWQDAINNGSAPRKFLGTGGGDLAANLGAGYTAIQNCGIWGISAMDNNAPDVDYGIFKLPIPEGGTSSTVAGGWAFVANAKGKDPDTSSKFAVWALGSTAEDSVQRVVDWCIKAKSDMSPRRSASDAAVEQGGYSEGGLKIFHDDIAPSARAEPRVVPEVYKAVSDAIQATQLDGADPQQAGEQAAQAIETFLATYTGAPIL
jgi:multiple sugar transport system substrate-binding protein